MFTVTLPFKLPADVPGFIENARKAACLPADCNGPVLVADDDESALNAVAGILRNAGIETYAAADCETALKEKAPFKSALIDYNLGGNWADYKKLAEGLRKRSEDIKLILTYTRHKTPSREDIIAADYNDSLGKPFIVTELLRKVCRSAPADGGAEEEYVHPEVSFPDARVLLVEDNEINQLVAMSILENFDIVPEIANNGAEAIEILENKEFDLVLMDIVMPVMDGSKTTAAIRGGGKPYCNVPIVAMTANVMPNEIEGYLSIGMNGHLEKPIDVDALVSILVKYL